jgi:hypothetical protein
MKQKKKGKNYAGKRFFFYIYDVITSPEKEKALLNTTPKPRTLNPEP